ncbi:MAG: sigma-54-dependent Fis family transcriptional regulator [Piscirickettsiaceae bacterium CG_4_9_14_3_um_filter_43_564]|nr:sigma-54-dependent Fis family transcriptional regulator [Thiomicrospira sp.]OIP96124.1 MAG: sigma-54-dependent Fis family transcriptional regulator [Thiomicrospira sp. CG2_30_44_34]PIQ02659.1 MAG: sigma-54-dependent Fis family transcriptional regulator [Piscirickettsiaceae bacterium CG18_big_fil_WC_8_21_14_2_50_44_103]PIU38544.1 MAG: sigma-54-dependent Fis family transcriptional regulator [Piscirickettsiaceae bacterium CG07_land_8_20_14_0_80_44_28]PIW57645.1 MAG: sigma-54-dependent Fis famil
MSIAKILVVEDDSELQEALVDTLELNGFEVVAVSSAEDALVALDDEIAMIFTDIRMDGMNGYDLMTRIRAIKPYLPIVLMTAYGTVEQAVEAMKAGAVDYILKPFEADVLVEKAKSYFYRDASSDEDFVVADPTTIQLKALAQKVAESDTSVMITGESGTGKEVLARFIHNHSTRNKEPFIAINCAAIPENMLEATLFGYEKGAFTGALKAMPGKFELAQNGTIFLDEIGEMKPELQAKLLRVLQEREVERIGSSRIIKLDVRVLSASNVDMKSAISKGSFREDLFYRLNVFPMRLPPLRDRPKDIAAITERLLQRHCGGRRVEPMISAPAMRALIQYPWPGNIRELDNVIQRALVMMSGDAIQLQDIFLDETFADLTDSITSEYSGLESVKISETAPVRDVEPPSASMDLKEREVQIILETLKANNGHRQKTAEALNISPRTLRYKLAKFKEQGLEVV